MKRLTKSVDRKLFGVCGGVAEYFDVDPTFVRLATITLLVLGVGSPVMIYLVMALVMRDE